MAKVGAFSRKPGERRVVALAGIGAGPKVAFRSEIARLRISGLAEGGFVELSVDDVTLSKFVENGSYSIPGGQFAKATSENLSPVLCEIFTQRS